MSEAASWHERCDALALARLRARCASGAAAADQAMLAEQIGKTSAERIRRQLAAIDAERASHGGNSSGPDVSDRASRFLATIGDGPGDAWRAALHLVRGWALSESAALAMLEREYAPRYHRALPRVEIVGMVRRASRSTGTGYGWHLRGERTR